MKATSLISYPLPPCGGGLGMGDQPRYWGHPLKTFPERMITSKPQLRNAGSLSSRVASSEGQAMAECFSVDWR